MFFITLIFIVFSLSAHAALLKEDAEKTLVSAVAIQGVNSIDLDKYKIIKDRHCEIKIEKDNNDKEKVKKLQMNNSTRAFYDKLSELDKKIYIRLIETGYLNSQVNKSPYMKVYKEDGIFYLESLAHVQIPFSDALPVIKDFSDYGSWLLKDINVRRGGKGGSYFLDINGMTYSKAGSFWNFLVKLNTPLLGGNYTVAFNIEDSLDDSPVPSLSLHIRKSTSLAKTMNGTFRFLRLPCDDTFFVGYFNGDTRLHSFLYTFLSVDVLNSQVGERIETMLENINYKAEDIEADNMRKKFRAQRR